MITKVKQFIKQFHMIHPDDHIVVGLSGGADSVCLLYLLCQLKKEIPFTLSAIHIHHGLRKESDMEEAFVKELCDKWKVPCCIKKIDVLSYQKEHHTGIEESARILRYQVFEQEADSQKKIALAHHKNDQAETVLFQMFRGSSLRGLRGMQPIRDCFIRPLLCVTRSQIEEFLTKNGISYVTDQSNYDTVFSRNCIRHEILPIAEKEICTCVTEHICASAESVELALQYLDEEAERLFTEYVEPTQSGCRIAIDWLKKQHPYMKQELTYRMYSFCCQKKKDITRQHIQSVLNLLEGQSGKKICLLYHTKAYVDQHHLYLEKECDVSNSDIKEAIDPVVEMRIFSYEKDQNVPRGNYTKWFDYDKIRETATLRYRKRGDYFFCTKTARKKLQDYMVDEKIPLAMRDRIPLIADGDHIMWIIGYRISEYYKVTDETRQVLEITVKEENT
ncbi:MAG: tRNA lysidine(34) synthetase TilS [Lachnospiraceae bacterium]